MLHFSKRAKSRGLDVIYLAGLLQEKTSACTYIRDFNAIAVFMFIWL